MSETDTAAFLNPRHRMIYIRHRLIELREERERLMHEMQILRNELGMAQPNKKVEGTPAA